MCSGVEKEWWELKGEGGGSSQRERQETRVRKGGRCVCVKFRNRQVHEETCYHQNDQRAKPTTDRCLPCSIGGEEKEGEKVSEEKPKLPPPA